MRKGSGGGLSLGGGSGSGGGQSAAPNRFPHNENLNGILSGMETWFSNYRDACGVDTFFGYRRNDKRGAVSYTFKGYGKATLNVGNCLSQGRVDIYLNNVRQTFLRGRQYTSFVFNYKRATCC